MDGWMAIDPFQTDDSKVRWNWLGRVGAATCTLSKIEKTITDELVTSTPGLGSRAARGLPLIDRRIHSPFPPDKRTTLPPVVW